MSYPTLVSFVLYFVGMIVIGIVAWRRTLSISDFVLGGRRLGAVVTALSAGASGMSGWLLLALPGAFYLFGLNQIWMVIGLSVGAYINWSVIAPRLRRVTEKAHNSLTLPDYFEARFDDRTRALRMVSAGIILVFFTIYTASGLVSGAVLFSATFDLTYQQALWIGATMIVSYTFLGGFLAVSWTDVVQGVLMLLALIAVPVAVMQELGGWPQTVREIGVLKPEHLSAYSSVSLLSVVSLVAWGLGYFGQPHILARFMAMKSPAEMPVARALGMWWMILSLYGAMAAGFVAVAYFGSSSLDNPETAFIGLVDAVFAPWIAGIFLAAVLAAIMSTADSQLIVATSALSEDLYRAFFRKTATETELLWVTRAGVLIIAMIALLIASDPDNRVLDIVAYAWAGFGAGFGPSIILSLLWRRMTRNGALAGMIAGSATVILWGNMQGGIFDVYEILPGFIASSFAIFVFSLLQPIALGTETFLDD